MHASSALKLPKTPTRLPEDPMFNALFNKLPIALKTYVQKKLVKYDSYELICVKMH
jgi:hypothetical protein